MLLKAIRYGIALLSGMGTVQTYALCVLMQDFDRQDSAFQKFIEADFYYGTHRRPWIAPVEIKYQGRKKTVPIPAKIKMAGEPCVIFQTYYQLHDFIRNRQDYPDAYLYPGLSTVKLPPVEPGEPLLISQISHGSPGGEVDAGPILRIADALADHPIGIMSTACYSSDLIMRMALEQARPNGQNKLANLCLITASPFSNVTIAPHDRDPFVNFLKGIDETQQGTSLAQYYREHNNLDLYHVFNAPPDHPVSVPLALCSAANWGELGLVDYVTMANAKSMLEFNPAQDYQRDWQQFSHEENLAFLAAHTLNNLNKLLNLNYCRRQESDPPFAEAQMMYYMANTTCSSVDDLGFAQQILPAYYKSKGAAAIARFKSLALALPGKLKWNKDCKNNSSLQKILRQLKKHRPLDDDPLLQEFFTISAQFSTSCGIFSCMQAFFEAFNSPEFSHLNLAGFNEFSPEDRAKLYASIKQHLADFNYLNEWAQQFQDATGREMSGGQLDEQIQQIIHQKGFDIFNCSDLMAQALTPEKFFQSAPNQELQRSCKVLHQTMAHDPPSTWPPRRTDYTAQDTYPDQLLHTMLTDQQLFNIPPDEIMPDSPWNTMASIFHHIMQVAMESPPQNEMDRVRRQACENFKLGLKAASGAPSSSAPAKAN